MSGLSNVTDRICDKIEENEGKISTELQELRQGIACYTCGGTGGWRRAVYFDMTDPNTNCPSGWNMTEYSKRTCGRATDDWSTCDSVFFPVTGGPYSQVCGRIRAYQWGLPNAFDRSRYGQRFN